MTYLNKFIEDELALRAKHYKENPISIIEHYNIEQQTIQTYNGRQLFEMLQNADDASNTASTKKALIKLNGNKLTICNNGESFSKEGFRSITNSYLSPKTMQQNKIGQKGLGFRAILSWAEEVIISSGGTKLIFSQKIAQLFLKGLIKETPAIAELIKQTSKSEFPIATLRVPKLLNESGDLEIYFDTVITLILKDNIIADVQSQIHSVINKETLIFLNHLEEVEIDSPERKVYFKKTITGNIVSVESYDLQTEIRESKKWYINKISGDHNSKNFELAIAWNEELNDNENVIFSNFKTQVRFPFPALVHGTFELTQDRNQLENDTSGHNEFLTGKLADLLIDTALKIASQKREADYLPLKLLNIDFEKIDSLLTNFKFKEKLFEKIKANKVFPTVNGNYISFSEEPVFYEFPVAKLLSGEDVKNLMLSSEDGQFNIFLKSVTNFYYYYLKHYLKTISKRNNNVESLARLIYHAFSYNQYKLDLSSAEFKIIDQPEFLIDDEGNPIKWTSTIFIQPQGEIEFKIPKSISIRFIKSELVDALIKEFDCKDIDDLIKKLEPFQVKKYSFTEVSITIIRYYTAKRRLRLVDIKELHIHLFRLFKNESKNVKLNHISDEVNAPVISDRNKISSAIEIYFGKNYGNILTERLYSFDKSKLLADKSVFGLEKADSKIVKDYFLWLGVADLPRYYLKAKSPNIQDSYIQFLLRSIKYPTLKWGYQFKTYNDLSKWLPLNLTLHIGEYDDVDKILSNCKIEYIFDWIKQAKELKETLENDREILSGSQLSFFKYSYRNLDKQDIRSYMKWKISTAKFLPVESESLKSSPEKCCLSKTITSEFSPFVEKPKIAIAEISEKLHLSEDIIENYLTLIGVHREISSFSNDILYDMLFSLVTSDKEGKVAKSIYREIINNYDQNKLDTLNSTYQKFLKTGQVLCQKGNVLGYYPVNDSRYIETKTLSNNILKLYPLVCIDRKKGNKKVERLFGVKPLENISFKILGEPAIHSLNLPFASEIHRFKALIYSLRMHQDTKGEIKRVLKRLKIILTYNIKAEYIDDQNTQKFEVEQYDFIVTRNKSSFHILIPESATNLDELRQNYLFCDSIAEIFTTLLNTEEFRDFMHHLYSIREIDRETELLNYQQQETNDIIIQAKKELEIIDDIRLSFWRAFSIASAKKIKTEIRNEKELNSFISRNFKSDIDTMNKVTSIDTLTQLSELSNQEFIYKLFQDFKIDFLTFVRHYSRIDFADLFKNSIEDLKTKYRNEFAFHLYNNLKNESTLLKGKYFDSWDDYNELTYNTEMGFLSDIEQYFMIIIQETFSIKLRNQGKYFSIQNLMNETLVSLTSEGTVFPTNLLENKRIQALLIFNEVEEIKREILLFNSSLSNNKPNQIRVGKTTIEYDDFQSLGQQVMIGLNILKLKLKKNCKTLAIDEIHIKGGRKGRRSKTRNVRFNAKNEEQIGFITELISYHKLCAEYGDENINWISENAFRAYPNKFTISEAGKGYDLEMKDEKDKVRFVEIKGIENIEDGIHMTKKEIKTALEFPEKYDLLIVENPLSNDPILRYIRNPFKFKSDETLFTNKKLKVYNDNYIIRFNWDE